MGLARWLDNARKVLESAPKCIVSELRHPLAYCLQKAGAFVSAQDVNEEEELQVCTFPL